MLWNRADDLVLVGEQAGLPDHLLRDYQHHYHQEPVAEECRWPQRRPPGRQFFDAQGRRQSAVPHRRAIAAIKQQPWNNAAPLILPWINDPAQSPPQFDDILKTLFHLSPAELRFCRQLLSGLTLKEATLELNISEATGRTHLKSLFAKLWGRRQSEMQRLLSRLDLID